MVFSGRQTIVCILLLLSLVANAQSQKAVDKAATSTISGKVTVGGKGLSGVVVALAISDQFRSNLRPTRFRSTTDEDGNYRITKVPPGNYEVIPASPVYIPGEFRKSLIVGKNETVENVDITLLRGGVITGKVTDADGNPVIDETVYVLASATTGQRLPYFRNIRTDDRGIYRAYGVPTGKYTVSAGRDPKSSVGKRPPEGEYQRTYHPSALDLDEATVIEVSEGSEATNVDITFGGSTNTYSARGRIIDSDTDKPIPNARVGVQVVMPNGSTSTMESVAESNKDGEFKVDNLPPGKYAVYSEPQAGSNRHSDAAKFEITDRDVEGLVVKTFGGASVSGVVVLEGTDDTKVRANLLAARILGRIVDEYVGRRDPSSTINPNGSFQLSGLAPGRLMLDLQTSEPFRIMRVERDGIVSPRGIEIKEGEQVTDLRVVVGFGSGAIRGVIKVPTDFVLPTNAHFRVVIRRNEDLAPIPFGTPIQVDSRGHFRAEGLIPGTYEVVVIVYMDAASVQPPRIPPARQTVVVADGAVADVTLTLQIPKPPNKP